MNTSLPMELEDQGTYYHPRLSVYLACSLTSEEDRNFKDEILSHTAKIFTEAGFAVHNPALHTPPGSPHTPSEVYFEDLFYTIKSDFIFFLRLGRSLGMGIEAQLGADVLLPWGDAQVADNSYILSPLLAGLSNAEAICRVTVAADSPNQFYTCLAHLLSDQTRMERLRAARLARDSAHSLVCAISFGYHVRVHRLIFGLSTTVLGALTDIDPIWIEAIESDSRFVSKLTLIQFTRLCDTLELTFKTSSDRAPGSFPTLTPSVAVPPDLLGAAKKFADYSYETGSPSTRRPLDDALLTRWQDWLAPKNLSVMQHQPAACPSSGRALRIFLCPPLSNVRLAEQEARDRLIEEITKTLTDSGILVEIETPIIQKSNRRDHGPAIYLNRLTRLRNTDLAITLLDPPSTGVGIMLQLFHNATIPCLCATTEWAAVSRMVRGLAPSRLSYLEYQSPRELGSKLANWLKINAERIRESRGYRERAWQRLGGLDIRRAMELAEIMQATVSGMPCLREEFLEQLVTTQDMAGTLTLLQLAYVANVQKWQFVASHSNQFLIQPPLEGMPASICKNERKMEAARVSLMTLWEALEECRPAISATRAANEWATFVAELSHDAARKPNRIQKETGLARSKEHWIRVFRAKEEL